MKTRKLLAICCVIFSMNSFASVQEIMIRSGLTETLVAMPEQMREQVSAGFSQAQLPDGFSEILLTTFDESFNTTRLVGQMSENLQRELSSNQVDALMDWYQTDLGQKITNLELKMNEPEAGERLMASMDSLLLPGPRLDQARSMDRILQATEKTMEMAGAVQQAVVSAFAQDVNAEEMELIRAEIRKAMEASRSEIEKYTLASLVYTYQELSEAELTKYAELLESPAGMKFYEVTMNVLVAETVVMMDNFISSLLPRFKAEAALNS